MQRGKDMRGSRGTSPRVHYAWLVLAASTLVVFGCLGLARFGYGLILPSMQDGLGLDNTGAGSLATAGVLAAHFGPRVVVALGLGAAGVGMFLTGLSETLWTALVFQFIAGMGSGASNVPVMGLLSAWFGPKRRGFAAGVAVTGSSLALIALGPLVPWILERFSEDGWRVCWYLFGVVTVGLALFSYVILRNDPSEKGMRPLGLGEDELMPGDPTAEGAGAGEKDAVGPVGRGGRMGRPSWSSVYKSGAVWHLGFVYIAFGFSYIIYMTFFAKHLIDAGGYSTSGAGTLYMVMGWFSLLCGVLWGAISDRVGRGRALAGVYAVHAIAFGLFAVWPAPVGFTLSAVLFGLSAWSIPAIMAATCGDVVGHRMAPAALGFITLFFAVGQTIGPIAAGALADAAGTLHPVYLLAAVAALGGVLGAVTLRSEKPSRSASLTEPSRG